MSNIDEIGSKSWKKLVEGEREEFCIWRFEKEGDREQGSGTLGGLAVMSPEYQDAQLM